MPQMSPMSWLTLFFYFNFLFIIMMIINYYSFMYTPHYLNSKIFTSINKKNWKW
uniref:ATP synthase complex subunit 8 n=1 Tax=Hylastes ater TaxID=512079 RepID=A0A343A5G0_9CUCU|nr:ATP synthase F0 subunit 8 [Hylastes ater]